MKFSLLISSIICASLAAENTFPEQKSAITYQEQFKDVEFAEPTKDHFFYINMGATYYVPTVGLGWRGQKGHWGFDCNAKVSWLLLPISYQGNAALLYYHRPNPEGQLYAGLGISGMVPIFGFFPSDNRSFVGPLLIFGKSYSNNNFNRRFWQFNIEAYPNKRYRFDRVKKQIMPVVSFSYGVGF